MTPLGTTKAKMSEKSSFLYLKRRKNPRNDSSFGYYGRLGEKAEITSAAFKLKSKDNLQNKKQRAF